MNSKYFLIVATKADNKRLKFYDQLQLSAEVVLIGCDKIYCIFAKVQSFLLRVSK